MKNTNNYIYLEADHQQPITSIEKINEVLAEIGVGIWPLDFSNESDEIKHSLQQKTLTEPELALLTKRFLFSREQLLEILKRAGRKPHVENGGSMQTTQLPEGHHYPLLFVKQEDIDLSRFDRFHINVAENGVGTDEIIQLLSGGEYQFHLQVTNGKTVILHVTCPKDQGWLVTYSGGNPHIGSHAKAAIGSKILVQVIGPAEWQMQYI